MSQSTPDNVSLRPFRKVMVANRGEIAIRVFRACTELGIRTVAIYSEEDRLHIHRYKADEAYLVGSGRTPIDAYLGYEEIIDLALQRDVDAIHPGYGFLAENADFARACQEVGIKFIGPSVSVLEAMGDKVAARHIASKANVPTIPGTKNAIASNQEALLFSKEYGFPIMVKAAMGGGGRGMSITRNNEELTQAMNRCRAEAQASFGNPKIFLERYLEKPKHIEVQILGDEHGNLVHLFERDCSIQRRHQKIVEIAPSSHLSKELRENLYRDALSICREVNYSNAGTVEFLVDQTGKHYFIEVNPRIQVEHTVTEVITGRDLVQCQIRVAEGYRLDSDKIRIASQDKIKKSGYCIELRVTTEDPRNNFSPDTGKISTFRAGEGFGIRLDAGSGFDGAVISPHYDSLLIKVCAWGLDFDLAATKALRAIREFRIRGVKTNIPFLENLLQHPTFLSHKCDTTFVDTHPELCEFKTRRDRATKILNYLADVTINHFPNIDQRLKPMIMEKPLIPDVPTTTPPSSPAYKIFQEKGASGLSQWLCDQKTLLFTDTTFRDAHQSLVATRVRSFDLSRIAHATAHLAQPLFSCEMWGGATFDVAYRFLHESPWERLSNLRELMPGTLLQMLLRSGNAVGYTNYPDNVVNRFIDLSAKNGIDVFRIFDSLNWVEAMKPCIERVVSTGKIAEASVCYSGDLTDSKRTKFTLPYYVNIAKELEKAGAHILAIKDMAGLLKPDAARILVTELKNVLQIPVHLHTHDTSGNGVATLLEASKVGVDIVDACLSSMSGVTSQPSLNALVAALSSSERKTDFDLFAIQRLADYWELTRQVYAPFECGLKAGTGDVYYHEIPGGQYSNYRPQAIAVGLGDRWEEVKHGYRMVNDMLGEIIKVTPSSKAVGDMALFMVQNNLKPEDIVRKSKELAFPDSFITLMKGMMGQVPGGFPPEIQKAALKGEEPITCRPGELLPDFDYVEARKTLEKKFTRSFSEEGLVSYSLYPQVYTEYCRLYEQYGRLSVLESDLFFYGLKIGEQRFVIIEEGKALVIKLLAIGDLKEDGTREIFFELNGSRRSTSVLDRSSGVEVKQSEKADPDNSKHIGAPMSGKVVELHVEKGQEVTQGQKLVATEAMKMLYVVTAAQDGTVKRILFGEGDQVKAGDLICELE